MVLVLVLADLHIPHRALDIPALFKEMLVPGKIQHVLCAGNLCSRDVLEFLRTVAGDVHVVKGDFDDNASFPENKVITIGKFRIGLCHGHQVVPWGDIESLAMLQRDLNCDLLITGHTHKFQAIEYEGRFMLNPGSITGAYNGFTYDAVPSFALLDIDGDKATTYCYTLQQVQDETGQMKEDMSIESIDFVKSS
eukprot:gnl/Hemi2/1699_TR600_c0_g1_i1.p1 gnl/Hemi2/1699_TR600_c0_g1~~gnl/Hemi2/1699_TR600_c0_g1_i1.p1  ORF type:complete len:194 (-),score=62.10 gnl/Hemi2/1699_TR600_c0_g1_i1:255-836(-)